MWMGLLGIAMAEPRPNILLIITDDQGFGDVAIHGNEWIETPNMDRIAQEGARFERFFVEPVCAPTRAALLSGRYPARTGVTGVTRGLENMRGEEVTMAEVLREAGYATGCFGKWHNGAHWPYHPNGQGFDEFVGFCGGHWNDYYDPMLEQNGEYFQARGYIADIITGRAIEFMENNSEKPFFCYVPYNTPHTPASAAVKDWERWKGRDDVEDAFTRCMYAMCENLDANIGRMLAHLEFSGKKEGTIVIFMTDNGPNGERFNGHMLGRKGSEHEGGVRVPLFVRWPEKVRAGTIVSSNVAHIDLLPTLCSLVGIKAPDAAPLDGTDVSPLLLGNAEFQMPERYLYTWRNPKRWSIRSPRYRATARTLHDIWDDPGQKVNLAKEKPELHQKLVEAYRVWAAEATEPDPIPALIPIGYEQWPRVTIKAHEFEIYPGAKQGIDYCGPNGYANQWIEEWSDPEAYAECQAKVVEAGRYRVTLRYACGEESRGSIFRLSLGDDQVLPIVVTEPFVSEPAPAAEQVMVRGGYQSREWRDLEAGIMTLKEGEFKMRLAVDKRPGEFMPDVKAVILEKVE